MLSSFNTAVSGLRAAQSGLSVVGHNITNAETPGYTRQQTIQKDFFSKTIGQNANGPMQVGLGVSVSEVRQIRNKFYDISYREQVGKANFYSAKYVTGSEVESILGELESDYSTQGTLQNLWNSINDLTNFPSGIETRESFIENVATFLNKVDDMKTSLFDYQLNINDQVKGTVKRINSIVSDIDELNNYIIKAEADGKDANDYRDKRNDLIDELSGLADITVKEASNGRNDILINGRELLVNGKQNKIGLQYSSDKYPFVRPVFTESDEIIQYEGNLTEAEKKSYKKIYDERDLSALGDKSGLLKGLLVSRGDTVANYTTFLNPDGTVNNADAENAVIPGLQFKIDTLVHSIVNLFNESVNPTDGSDKPYGLGTDPDTGEKIQGVRIFIRKSELTDPPLCGADDPENPNDKNSLYTMDNIILNPKLLEEGGYNYLCLSPSSDPSDTSLLNKMSEAWKSGMDELGNVSVDTYYKNMITDFAVSTEEAKNNYEGQNTLLQSSKNSRLAMSSVSLDEELSSMLKYQYAYNAASKLVTAIDEMVQQVLNM